MLLQVPLSNPPTTKNARLPRCKSLTFHPETDAHQQTAMLAVHLEHLELCSFLAKKWVVARFGQAEIPSGCFCLGLRVRIGSSKLIPAELSTRRLHSRVDAWRHRGGMVDLRWVEAAWRQNTWHRSDIRVQWTIRTHVTWNSRQSWLGVQLTTNILVPCSMFVVNLSSTFSCMLKLTGWARVQLSAGHAVAKLRQDAILSANGRLAFQVMSSNGSWFC